MVCLQYGKTNLLYPPREVVIPLIHVVKEVYARAYQIGNTLPKRDKLGIHTQVEELILEILRYVIQACFSKKESKIESLEITRVLLEVLKHLIRTEYELHIIKENQYIQLESCAVEASKMANGWIKYIAQSPE